MLIIYQYTSYERCDFRTKGYGRTTVKKPCHIVFILKTIHELLFADTRSSSWVSFVKFVLLSPVYLQHAPLPAEPHSSGNATDYRWYAVSWDSHPSEDRSEPPLVLQRDRSIIIPNFSIMAISRTTRLFSLSVDRSLRRRSWRQKTSRFEKRGKIRSTELFSCQSTVKWA